MTAAATTVDAYLDQLVDVVEGGVFTDDPYDAGGPTRWGITQKTLAQYRRHPVTTSDVAALTRDEALAIYRAQYVNGPGFDALAAVSAPVALEVIDAGVNMGVGVAARYLQRCLNVLNQSGAWPVLVVDGNCGPKTAATLATYLRQRGARGEVLLVTALNCLQGADYIRLAETSALNRKFIYGWLSARVLQNLRDWTCTGVTA